MAPNHTAIKQQGQYFYPSLYGTKAQACNHRAIPNSSKRKRNERIIWSLTAPQYEEICSEAQSLPGGSELPRGGVSSKDAQPSDKKKKKKIRACKQKDGSATRGEGNGERGIKSLAFLASIFQFWILLEDPRPSSHFFRPRTLIQLFHPLHI